MFKREADDLGFPRQVKFGPRFAVVLEVYE
jgi:hypothetical protein